VKPRSSEIDVLGKVKSEWPNNLTIE